MPEPTPTTADSIRAGRPALAARPEQIAADAAETEAAERYVRQRRLVGTVAEAIARAEAMWRLETALQRRPPGS
jgi:hypothetical protein